MELLAARLRDLFDAPLVGWVDLQQRLQESARLTAELLLRLDGNEKAYSRLKGVYSTARRSASRRSLPGVLRGTCSGSCDSGDDTKLFKEYERRRWAESPSNRATRRFSCMFCGEKDHRLRRLSNVRKDVSCRASDGLPDGAGPLGPKARRALRLSRRLSRGIHREQCRSKSSRSTSSGSGVHSNKKRIVFRTGRSPARRVYSCGESLALAPPLEDETRSRSRRTEDSVAWRMKLSEEMRGLSAAVTALRAKQNSTEESTRTVARQAVRAEAELLRRRVCVTVSRMTKNLTESHTELESRITALASLVLPQRGGLACLLPPSCTDKKRPARQRALSQDCMTSDPAQPPKSFLLLRTSCKQHNAGNRLCRSESCAPSPYGRYTSLPDVAHAVYLLQQQQQGKLRRLAVVETAQQRLEQMHRASAAALKAQYREQQVQLHQQQQQIVSMQQETQQHLLQLQQFESQWQEHHRCHAKSDDSRQKDIMMLLSRQQQLVQGETEIRRALELQEERHQSHEEQLQQLKAAQHQLEASLPAGLRDELTQLQELQMQCNTALRQTTTAAAAAARAADAHAALEARVTELAAAAQATEERQGREGVRQREAQQALQHRMGFVRTSLHRLAGEVNDLKTFAHDTKAMLKRQQVMQQHLEQQSLEQMQRLQCLPLQLQQERALGQSKVGLYTTCHTASVLPRVLQPYEACCAPCVRPIPNSKMQQQAWPCPANQFQAPSPHEKEASARLKAPTAEPQAWHPQPFDREAYIQHVAETQSKLALLQKQTARTTQLLNTTVRDQAVLIETLTAEQQIGRWSWHGPLPMKHLASHMQKGGGTTMPQGAPQPQCLVRVAQEAPWWTAARQGPNSSKGCEREAAVEDENADPQNNTCSKAKLRATSKSRQPDRRKISEPPPLMRAQTIISWDREETNNCSHVFSWVSGGGSIQLKVGGLFEVQLLVWLYTSSKPPTELPDLCLLLNGSVIARCAPQQATQFSERAGNRKTHSSGITPEDSLWSAAVAGNCSVLLHTVAAVPSAANLEVAWELPIRLAANATAKETAISSSGDSDEDTSVKALALLTARLLPLTLSTT